MKKKLTPASIYSQKKWASLPITKKNSLRKMLPDKDKDGVPDKYDCRPKNKRKQESFLSEDKFLLPGTPVELGEEIDKGGTSTVYEVVGNDNLVVKVPTCRSSDNFSGKCRCDKRHTLESEIRGCRALNATHRTLLTPSKVVNVIRNGHKCFGILRPKVMVFCEGTSHKITDDQIEKLRLKVIELSRDGICLDDGLQVGIDKAGRLLQFDMGQVYEDYPSTAFVINERMWEYFLLEIGKFNKGDISGRNRCLAKYGTIHN